LNPWLLQPNEEEIKTKSTATALSTVRKVSAAAAATTAATATQEKRQNAKVIRQLSKGRESFPNVFLLTW
jgi:hypothetical protein